jgi:antitoxin (DNA-binding transcriptional repressor) of toxin-antitoxin stability system
MTQPKRVPMAEARASLRDLVDDVNRGPERIKLTRYDKTIAGIVSARDLHILEECKEAHEKAAQTGKDPKSGKRARTTPRSRGRRAASR